MVFPSLDSPSYWAADSDPGFYFPRIIWTEKIDRTDTTSQGSDSNVQVKTPFPVDEHPRNQATLLFDSALCILEVCIIKLR